MDGAGWKSTKMDIWNMRIWMENYKDIKMDEYMAGEVPKWTLKDGNMDGEVQKREKWMDICMAPTGTVQRWIYKK